MLSISKQIEDTFVVWYAPANRYMQLKKPAFKVWEDITNCLPHTRIVENCAADNKIPSQIARRFVSEIHELLQASVLQFRIENTEPPVCQSEQFPAGNKYSTKHYRIQNRNFRFNYFSSELETLLHPGLAAFQSSETEAETACRFDLYASGEMYYLRLNNRDGWKCPRSNPEHFLGLFKLKLMNCLYQTNDAHWMGAVHASAVSNGNGAVLFAAASGSGKSTFAAILQSKGFRVLSDDFSPLALHTQKVVPFPEGISVKNRSLKALQQWYPELKTYGSRLPESNREIFLPLNDSHLAKPEPVKAIVFLKYDESCPFEFKAVPNLDAMDRFLQDMWLNPTAEVAQQFLDWYFKIPCYTLRYSDAEQAVEQVSGLLQNN